MKSLKFIALSLVIILGSCKKIEFSNQYDPEFPNERNYTLDISHQIIYESLTQDGKIEKNEEVLIKMTIKNNGPDVAHMQGYTLKYPAGYAALNATITPAYDYIQQSGAYTNVISEFKGDGIGHAAGGDFAKPGYMAPSGGIFYPSIVSSTSGNCLLKIKRNSTTYTTTAPIEVQISVYGKNALEKTYSTYIINLTNI